MRVNIYAEEMTDRVEIISKTIDGYTFLGVRFYLELPVTKGEEQVKGPFIHREGDDDSSAVTFWGKNDLRVVLKKALDLLDEMHAKQGWHFTEGPPQVGDLNFIPRAFGKTADGEPIDASRVVNSIGTCTKCGYHGPGPKHDCKPRTSLPRTPEGHINNCALANGDDEADCQMCKGDCPDGRTVRVRR